MSAPFLLVQLSDPHIGASWGGGDPVAGLTAAIAAVRGLRPAPDAVLVSGDLADTAAPAEYEQARALLATLGVPVHVLPGNHDDRAALRRTFGLSGEGGEPVRYAADLGPLRLVALDTTIPGQDGGHLAPEQLAWLEATLAAAPRTPTVLAMHHPPLHTGIPGLDAFALREDGRRALAAVVEPHGHVRRIVGGHVHRTIAATLAGRPVLTAASTYVQVELDFRAPQIAFGADPAAFAVHALADGELSSHVQPVRPG